MAETSWSMADGFKRASRQVKEGLSSSSDDSSASDDAIVREDVERDESTSESASPSSKQAPVSQALVLAIRPRCPNTHRLSSPVKQNEAGRTEAALSQEDSAAASDTYQGYCPPERWIVNWIHPTQLGLRIRRQTAMATIICLILLILVLLMVAIILLAKMGLISL